MTAAQPDFEADRERRSTALPRTTPPPPDGLDRPEVFDPALKHFARGYRPGEPRFAEPAAEAAWRRARRTALDAVLAAIARGPFAEHLVVRGSVLLAAWFPDAAREPGDVDVVVTPASWAMDGPEAAGLLDALARGAAEASAEGPVRIDASAAVTEDIWTYERAPGRRLLLPWTCEGTPGGTVQLDAVFGEPLAVPPAHVEPVPLGDGPPSRFLAASPELSLAWKIQWLISDTYPQGKDLYDAVLLAEHTPPTYALLSAVLPAAGEALGQPPGAWWLHEGAPGFEWDHFAEEYPRLAAAASEEECLARLHAALEPVLAEAARRPEDGSAYPRWARWLAPAVERARAEGASAVVDRFGAEGGRYGFLAAVVVTRELLGGERVPLREAAEELWREDGRSARLWRFWREREDWTREALAELS